MDAPDMSEMTTSGAWVTMYANFLEELSGQFPDNDAIKRALENAQGATSDAQQASDLLKEFSDALIPRQRLLSNRDPSLFDGLVLSGIEFEPLWNSELMAEQSKKATFQYLSSLLLIAQTLQSIPPEILSTIETAAKSIAANFAGGGAGAIPDIASLASLFSAGLGGLGDAFPGATQQQQPDRSRLPAPPSTRGGSKKKKRSSHAP